MFSYSSPTFVRRVLNTCGITLTPFLLLGVFAASLSGQTLLEQNYNAEEDSFSVRLSLPVDPQGSIAKGDQNYRLQMGFLMPNGAKVLPNGSGTTILQSNCGYVLNEQTGVRTYEILWRFQLGLLVPTLVDLQPCLTITNVYGKTIWDANFGQVFQRADDGVQNDMRPHATIETPNLDTFVNGQAFMNLVVKVWYFTLLSSGDYLDVRRRGVSTDFGFRRSLAAAVLLSSDPACLVWSLQYQLYRRGPANLAQFWLAAWFGSLGTILYPVQADVAGDVLSDTEPPVVLDSDWCTKGENPIYLDLYPLFGRDASSNVFVNATVQDATAVDPTRTFFFIDNPICIEDSTFPTGFAQFFKGDLTDGVYRSSIWMQNDIDWKLWDENTRLGLKMMVCDIFGEETIFDIGEICLYGKDGVDVDSLKPDGLWNVRINGGDPLTLMDVESGFPETTVDLWASDAGKGIDGVSLTYRSPSGLNSFSVFVNANNLVEGDLNSGRFSTTTTVNRCLEAGLYDLSSVWLRDKAGNFCSWNGRIELEKFLATTDGSIQTQVEIINDKADVVLPYIASPLIINPTTADITTGPTTVPVTVTLADDDCGVSFAQISLIHCDDGRAQSLFGFLSRVDGDENSGVYSGTINVPAGATLGDYAPRLEIYDRNNNRAIYGPSFPFGFIVEENLELPEGSTVKVTVVSEIPKVPDETPPVLLTGEVDCSFDFVEAGGFVELVFSAQDLESGLDLGFGSFGSFGRGLNWVEILDPKGMFDQFVPLSLENLDFESNPTTNEFNATFRVRFFLPKGVKPGDYCFRLQLTNKCGLVSTYGFALGDTPFPEGFPSGCTIINSGAFDCTPPIPIEFVVTPGFLQSGEPATVNVSVRITDLGTGLQFGSLTVKNGLSPLQSFPQTLFFDSIGLPGEDERSVGTINDFVFQTSYQLTAEQFNGDFLSFCLDLTDCANNNRRYDSRICNSNFSYYPLPCDYAQLLILAAFGENDYLTRAAAPGVFPSSATPEQKVWDFDLDGDGIINLYEILLGTDPSDPNSLFKTVISFLVADGGVQAKLVSSNFEGDPWANATDHEDGLRIDFSPYNPQELSYTLYRVFQGENNDQREAISTDAQLDEATGNGYFILPFVENGLTNEIVAVGAEDPDFVP